MQSRARGVRFTELLTEAKAGTAEILARKDVRSVKVFHHPKLDVKQIEGLHVGRIKTLVKDIVDLRKEKSKVDRRIHMLHEYNEIKDIAQQLMGKL
eukprot:927908-Amorphochlora_amoeboformis.AAC.1